MVMRRIGEALARSDIDAIFFTGSSAVGRKLYKIAAEKFIPVHLELGGSDAGIVCEDAAQAERLASLMQTGMISHNGTDFSAPYNPFGGYKMSGFRKSGGKYGFRDACRVKAVCLRK